MNRKGGIKMASWVVHFRVCDYFLDGLSNISEEDFIVGNIGPDCGEPNEEWTAFNPPKKITHWWNEDKTINAEKFYETYIHEKHYDVKRSSFYLGYYVHLLTDILWSREIGQPTKIKYHDGYETFGYYEMWDKIKTDWYDLDGLFLKKHKDFRTYKIFESLKDYNNEYLPYYSERAIPMQLEYIPKFYSQQKDNFDREYIYLTEERMNKFVLTAQKEIEQVLKNKSLWG